MPEVLDGCRRAMFNITRREEMLLSGAVDEVEENLPVMSKMKKRGKKGFRKMKLKRSDWQQKSGC